MADIVKLWETPRANELFMLAGWRQWADAGSISSGLPAYVIERMGGRKIGEIDSNPFSLFQIPGTQGLVRPLVKFEDGYPVALDAARNELFYCSAGDRGLVVLLGDEPQVNPEEYVSAVLDAAETLNVKRIISLGGVYAELPYDKERLVHAIVSLPSLRAEMSALAAMLSDYHGPASIGSYLCRRAGERNLELIGFYSFVPTYDFSAVAQIGGIIRLEVDYLSWLGIMKRLNFML
jgi:hypothetical protein